MTVETLEICAGCGEVGKVGEDLIYDEHIDRFICQKCDMKREIGNLKR